MLVKGIKEIIKQTIITELKHTMGNSYKYTISEYDITECIHKNLTDAERERLIKWTASSVVAKLFEDIDRRKN